MKTFYALHPEFYNCLKKTPAILHQLHKLEGKQREKIFIAINAKELQESGSSYFQKDLVQEGDCIFYEHYLKSQVYMAECRNGAVLLDGKENPFYALLKRKYEYSLFVDDESQSMQ